MSFSVKINAIERRLPGWHVAAGPYEVEHQWDASRRQEKRACLTALSEQRAGGHCAKIVMVGREAWVLRRATAEDQERQRRATWLREWRDNRSNANLVKAKGGRR